MAGSNVLTTQNAGDWLRILEQSAAHDFYHLPQYHTLAEELGEGTARLFHYTEGAYALALPLLLRPLDPAALFALDGGDWRDATSVYGYAGPLCSHREVPAAVVDNFQAALRGWLSDLRVVSLFSRLHPLLPQRPLLKTLGECQRGSTVSIDLTLSAEEQRLHYRRSVRDWVHQLRKRGLTCLHDRDGAYLGEFVRIYHETMHRVGAAVRYFFPPAYFERLWRVLGPRCHLFICHLEGKPVSACLCVACDGILQYHLGGTLTEALKLSPMKLLLDEARQWATGQGLRVFHLGGGRTALPGDSLMHFKLGFSDRVHDFFTWRWVLRPDVYRKLCEARSRWNERRGLRDAVADFFPAYRCPTVPCGSSEGGSLATEF